MTPPRGTQLEINWLLAYRVGRLMHDVEPALFADHLTAPLELIRDACAWAHWTREEQIRLAGRFGVPVAVIRRQLDRAFPLPGYRLMR